MKKLLLLSLFLFVGTSLVFVSCNDDDDPVLGARVNVTVKNLAGVAQGKTVYMFKDTEPTNSTDPSTAKKQIVTDANGLAEFDLNFTELNIFESQTSLYFAVFYTIGSETFIAGTAAITIKRGQTRDLDINIPI